MQTSSAISIILFSLCLMQRGLSVARPGYLWGSRRNLTEEETSTRASVVVLPSYITAQHCCKVGESLLRKVNSCQDASLRTNNLIKGKRPNLRQEVAKELSYEVSRCQQHQHLLHKCCLFRLQYVIALETCDSKSFWERYRCRLGVKNRFGHK